jgi:hypothetical protein
MTNAYVPDEDPEECKLTLDCGRTVALAPFPQRKPLGELSDEGPLTFVFGRASERDDWLNSISRHRNSSMARVMRARQDGQAALASNDAVSLAWANQILRKPPFIVKRNYSDALGCVYITLHLKVRLTLFFRWRDSAETFTLSEQTSGMLGVEQSQISSGLPDIASVATTSKGDGTGKGKRSKSFGMSALNSVSSVILKARRVASSKKVTKLPLPPVRGRLSGDLDVCQLLLPIATDSLASHHIQFDPYAIFTFRSTGSICVSLAETTTPVHLANDSKILGRCFRQPYILTLHEDMRIQVYNIELDRKEFFSALHGISEDNSSSSFSPRSASLLCDWSRAVVIFTMGGVYKVQLFRFCQPPKSLSSQASSVLSHEATLTLFMPMDTLSRALYALIPVCEFSAIRGDQLLLACQDQWQLWSLTTSEILRFETNNIDGVITSFADVRWHGDTIIAISESTVHVWTLQHHRRLLSFRIGFVASCAFLDDFGILIGGQDGQILTRPHSRNANLVIAEDRGNQSVNAMAYKLSLDTTVTGVCHFQWRNSEFAVGVSAAGIRLWHLVSATLVKHWKSRGHRAISCSVVSDSLRLLVRPLSDRGPESSEELESIPYEIWQINLKFLDKWLLEHISNSASPEIFVADSTRVVTPSEDPTHLHSHLKSISQLNLRIPTVLGSDSFPWARTILFPKGVLATMYKGVGSILLRSESTSAIVENASPIISWTQTVRLLNDRQLFVTDLPW